MKKGVMLLVLLILVSGCVQKEIVEGESSLLDERDIFYDVVMSAYENGVEECDYLNSGVLRDSCINEYNKYVETGEMLEPPIESKREEVKDISECDSIECRDAYYINLVSQTGDISYCDKVSDNLKEGCRLLVK